MWSHSNLKRIDFRTIPILLCLMLISILVICATSHDLLETGEEGVLTTMAKNQIKWFILGWIVYIFFAGMDYRKLRKWTWLLYASMLILLFGLFFTPAIQNVHRWYRIPGVPIALQPSEYAKLVVVITLSWYLERGRIKTRRGGAWKGLLIVIVPFLLILKQPDLGSALVLYPITLVMFYFGGLQRKVIFPMTMLGALGIIFVSLIFLGILPHEEMRPVVTKVIKEYQFERLNPNTYHQTAAQTAIALGGITGSGWCKSEFTGRDWLPAAHTDSVFAAFGEEFGLIGVLILLLLFFGLIYFSFQVTAMAKDYFGRLLSAGITVYLAMHMIVNMGMMSGFLPITGVPLVLITYGGSSVIATMAALGILQSIYSRRFMF